MPKPVCVPCERFMRPKRNGYSWIEGMPVTEHHGTGKHALPGEWLPYKLWHSDLWYCPDCGAEIIVGHAREPIAEYHQQPAFARLADAFGATLLVKDC